MKRDAPISERHAVRAQDGRESMNEDLGDAQRPRDLTRMLSSRTTECYITSSVVKKRGEERGRTCEDVLRC
jgi:hypothetical protein